MPNRITKLFNIKHPIIQAGMIWNSGWRLASAASNSGILGLIGAGSMYPDVLREHIQKCKVATDQPFGVNVPMLYPNIEEIHWQKIFVYVFYEFCIWFVYMVFIFLAALSKLEGGLWN